MPKIISAPKLSTNITTCDMRTNSAIGSSETELDKNKFVCRSATVSYLEKNWPFPKLFVPLQLERLKVTNNPRSR
ncbi:unnamed protein product [Amaranthus hypochondriacus]